MDQQAMTRRIGILSVIAIVVAACAPTAAPGPGKAEASPVAETRIYYGDSRTRPSQPELLKHLTRGKFYIPVQDDGFVAVVDPEHPGYLVKLIKITNTQPHHPWMPPGMRYMYINHQSEAKGDHNVMTVIDTFTDEVIAEIKTDFDDPFHCSSSPTKPDLMLCGDLNPKGGYVYYFDTVNHKFLSSIKTNGANARDVLITIDGKFAFAGHENPSKGNIDVIDIAEKKIVKTIACDRCGRMKLSGDGRWLVASSRPNDFSVIIDPEKQEIVKRIEFPKGSGPGNINFTKDNKLALIGLGAAGKLAMVDVPGGEIVATLDSGKATNTAYPHPYEPVAISTNDGTDDWYTIINTAERKVVERIEAGGKGTHNVGWSADGRFAVGSDRLGDTVTLFRWDAQAKKIVKVASVKVGFGTNGVLWTPYFCGVPFLTKENAPKVRNAAPTNAKGECPR